MIIKSEDSEPVDLILSLEIVQPKDEKHDISLPPRPQAAGRRRRVEVLLPTKRQLYGNNPPAFENASAFIEKNLQALIKQEEAKPAYLLSFYGKVKIKKEEMLSEDVVNRRIALFPSYDVDLDPVIRDVTTTRYFTSKHWSGNTQATIPSIRKSMLARHGLNDFMYLNLFFNPHAPQWPGAPGLFFTSSICPEADEWPSIERVLVRLKTGCWLYVGQYQCAPAATLTPEEWKAQAPKVRRTWTTRASTEGWKGIRAKTALQKRLGREPTTKELEDAIDSDEKFRATPEEVHRAFDEVRQFIRSWSMKCVGYDDNFQREIAAGSGAK